MDINYLLSAIRSDENWKIGVSGIEWNSCLRKPLMRERHFWVEWKVGEGEDKMSIFARLRSGERDS